MVRYRLVGDVPPKRHTQHRRPYFEEPIGGAGFSTDSSVPYHI
jgi:homogentisate 1,2-dioxygenase